MAGSRLDVTACLRYLFMSCTLLCSVDGNPHQSLWGYRVSIYVTHSSCAQCDFMRKVVDALLTSGLYWAYNSTRSPPPACACVCKSVSVTSVRTRSWLLWRWRRGRQRRNMIHGKLSRSSESGSKRWPQLWKKVLSPRWKPPCISARSFARLARYPAAHPGLPAAPLVSWPRMRVYVCYNNVAKGLAA